jgi:hypothetical protein
MSGTTEDLMEFFKRENVSCIFLYHKKMELIVVPPTITDTDDRSSVSTSSSGLQNELHSVSDEDNAASISIQDVANLSPSEAAEMRDYAECSKASLAVDDTQDLFLACVWVLPVERQQFRLFPYVVHIDATAGTNQETKHM